MLVEVILLAQARWVLEPLVVHGETFDQVFVQAPDGPLAELCAPVAAHAEADGKDGVQVVVLDLPRHFPFALGSNYPEFPDSWLATQFSLVENIYQVLVDRPHIFFEKLADECLREP